MNLTKNYTLHSSKSRINLTSTPSSQEEINSSVTKDIYVLCDGAIKKPNTVNKSRLLTIKQASSSNTNCNQVKTVNNTPETKKLKKKKSKQLAHADHTSLNTITSKKSLIWLQKLDKNKLSVQWNVPNNIQRNCQDLLLNGEKAEFVLRLYQNVTVGNAKWKTSQRTLEYPVDILRRKCYVNLENSGGGVFTAEIGVRSSNKRYIFIARSNKCSTPNFIPEYDKTGVTFKKNTSKKQNIKTPKVFKSKSKLNHLNVSNFELRDRDILSEALVSGIYTDFLREGPKVLRRSNEKISKSSVAARGDYLNRLKISEKKKNDLNKNGATQVQKNQTKLKSERLDQQHLIENFYQKSPIKNYPDKSEGYIPQHLKTKDINANGVMIASMLNTHRSVAIDVFKKGENPSPNSKNRQVVKVNSKKELAKAIKKSGIHEESELILSGKLKPGRRVRVGGLLINTESDGSFYVSCLIKNGKLHVPVEEIEAITVE